MFRFFKGMPRYLQVVQSAEVRSSGRGRATWAAVSWTGQPGGQGESQQLRDEMSQKRKRKDLATLPHGCRITASGWGGVLG